MLLAEEDGVAVFEQVAAQATEHQRAMEGLQVRETPLFSATVVAFVCPFAVFISFSWLRFNQFKFVSAGGALLAERGGAAS